MSEGHQHNERDRSPEETTTAHPGGSANRISIRIDANALAIVALVLSVGALVAVLMLSISMPQITDAKIAAATAPVGAEANEAKVNARVAAKELATLCASLRAAKVPNVDCH